MPTNDERREVAKELRDFFPIDLVSELTDVDCHLATMVMGDKFCPSDCLWCFETVCERLADLIEPPRQCPYYDSGRHRCSIHDVPTIDRDALLALADEMDEVTCDNRGELSISLGDVHGLARRIREACGEVGE